ncbi:hypothetical protein POM88_003967 [Heracleum sosnowskyi]|uniref:Reverse transcriptase zinc-binding domain-containing protein n=1 Tax=Heracleum sosnowskyi TaxID=360622 RepID=A0AAD8JH58_9APIA|nr:hypothetical protein POM88_003967 [Heracleum sosnowskyi]
MLKKNYWDKVGLSPYDYKWSDCGAGMFVGGRLHWAKYASNSSGGLELIYQEKSVSVMLKSILSANDAKSFNGAPNIANFRWKLGNGLQAFFWEHQWLKEGMPPLSTTFKRLYNILKLKFSTVKEMVLMWSNPSTSSNDLWIRDLRKWELEEICRLNDVISSISLTQGEDVLVWTHSNNPYTCSDGRKWLLRDTRVPSVTWNLIWRLKTPSCGN